jgi:hypothetical protein
MSVFTHKRVIEDTCCLVAILGLSGWIKELQYEDHSHTSTWPRELSHWQHEFHITPPYPFLESRARVTSAFCSDGRCVEKLSVFNFAACAHCLLSFLKNKMDVCVSLVCVVQFANRCMQSLSFSSTSKRRYKYFRCYPLIYTKVNNRWSVYCVTT